MCTSLGLLQHMVEVAKIAVGIYDAMETDKLCDVSRDCVISGALIHDIGKSACYHDNDGIYGQTPMQYLFDHKAVGFNYITSYMRRTGYGISAKNSETLLHIIMSHHGQYGDVKPKIPEAFIVHYADMISARLNAVYNDWAELDNGEYVHRGDQSKEPLIRPFENGFDTTILKR